MKVSWKSLAPIFAKVVIAPWNLLVGGILIQHLTIFNAIVSIVSGYSILALIFILYGGLGFRQRQQSSQILASVFGSKIVKYIIPLILAFGQIGWAAIYLDLGGRSLATLFSTPWFVGIGLYTIILTMIALLNLYKLGITKFIIILSSLPLLIILFFSKLQLNNLGELIKYQPQTEQSLFWGISIVTASMISFATVTPDFFKSVKTKKDVVLSSALGLFPGVFVALLGCFLFFDKTSLDMTAILGITALAFFPHLFNILTNSDGAIALYTPGLKLQSILPISFRSGVIIAGVISFILALTHISLYLPLWLSILSLLFPVFIGVCFSAFLFKKLFTKEIFYKEVTFASVFSLLLALASTAFFPPVLITLLAPIVLFLISYGYLNLSHS